jgi:hypothetical protein
MSAMRRIVLTGVCSLALVLTIGFGVSAASNGNGIAALLHPSVSSAKSGDDSAKTGDGSAKTGDGSAQTGDGSAQTGDESGQNAQKKFSGTPFEYDPGHTGIVAAAWVKHLGLPQGNDKNRFGLILSKNGTTPTNASAGLVVNGVKGLHLTELGFDVRNGGHCGAGAPRFNVVTNDGVTRFYGCTYGTHTPSTPAPGWQRVRYLTSVSYPGAPAFTSGLTVTSISIDFDEGTDIGPDFSGMVVLDNIDVNGALIGAP